MTLHMIQSMRDLHSRISDGIHVRMLWGAHDDRVVVTVDDSNTGDTFHIEVAGHERALDVFHHPFAHAAWRGVDFGIDFSACAPLST